MFRLNAATLGRTLGRLGTLRGASSTTYTPLFQSPNKEETPYTLVTTEGVREVEYPDGSPGLVVEPSALTALAARGMRDIAHLLRPAHLGQLSKIMEDPEASDNDRFVALQLLKNANIAAGMVLPGCQDTGTAIVMGKRGDHVMVAGGNDEAALSDGVVKTYAESNLRYSQVAPLSMYEEKNTGTNLPAQIDIYGTQGNEYHFMFMAKGGGSANKVGLFQQTKALLNEDSLIPFLEEKFKALGTAACPPYHLAFVIGGLSSDMNLKTVKLATAKYLDGLPTTGDETGRAFRDVELEAKIHQLTQQVGIGAQFGGKYFCHDVRVVRLPRHGASCPVGIGVSCSADRQALGKITKDGVFIETLETDPAKYLPDIPEDALGGGESGEVVKVDLNQPMETIRAQLSQYPVSTRLSLSGTIIVARDMAHAKFLELINQGKELPEYLKNHIIYYAGPAKTPEGYASGSFGPTTAGRMDSAVEPLMEHGASLITLAKGNRSAKVTRSCKKHKGFYLGSPGGPAAILAQDSIKKIEVLDYPELGMEAVHRIEISDFPAFIVVDDKGNDFFKRWAL